MSIYTRYCTVLTHKLRLASRSKNIFFHWRHHICKTGFFLKKKKKKKKKNSISKTWIDLRWRNGFIYLYILQIFVIIYLAYQWNSLKCMVQLSRELPWTMKHCESMDILYIVRNRNKFKFVIYWIYIKKKIDIRKVRKSENKENN